MKRFFFFLLAFFILLGAFPGFSFAQDQAGQGMSGKAMPAVYPEKIMPPVPEQALPPFGQSHFYTVTLRGNGEAVVQLKTIFSNSEDASVSAVTFTFPKAPQNLGVYQVSRAPQCIRYKPVPLGVEATKEAMDSMLVRYPPYQQECEEYQEPDYRYGWGNTSYQKAQFALDGDVVTVQLPKAVKPGGTGSLVLSFTSPMTSKKDVLGAYHFTFKTVQVNEMIKELQVGIMTDPDYYLKDTKGSINYQTRESLAMGAPAPVALDTSVQSAQFDQFYNQIGQGIIVKTASNFQPNESYEVKGVYADNKIKLYGKELLWGTVIVFVLLALAFGALFVGAKRVFDKTGKAIAPIFIVSFGSSLLILLYTGALYLFSVYFGQVFQYYSSGFVYPMVFILLAVISLSLYSLFLFVPGIVIGVKKGMVSGIVTVVMTIFWLIVYSIVLAVVFFFFFQKNDGPQIMPYLQSTDSLQRESVGVGQAVPPSAVNPVAEEQVDYVEN